LPNKLEKKNGLSILSADKSIQHFSLCNSSLF